MIVENVKYIEDVVRFNYKGEAKSKIEFVIKMMVDTNRKLEETNHVGVMVYLLERIDLTNSQYCIRYRLIDEYDTDEEIRRITDDLVEENGYKLYRKEGIPPVKNEGITSFIRYIMGGAVGIEEIENYKKTQIEIDEQIRRVKSLQKEQQQNILLQELQKTIYKGKYWERLKETLKTVTEEEYTFENTTPMTQILQGNHWKLDVKIDDFSREYKKVLLFKEYLGGIL